jgi:uncharacterized protein YlbG (UPF0298 family)
MGEVPLYGALLTSAFLSWFPSKKHGSLKYFKDIYYQGQNMALTVLYVPSSRTPNPVQGLRMADNINEVENFNLKMAQTKTGICLIRATFSRSGPP